MILREGTHICPGHEDSRPSLSVRRGRDGRWLLLCRAGCRTRDVLKAAGLQWADLFPESAARTSAPRPPLAPLVEARLEVLAEARRQPWNTPQHQLRNVAADQFRYAERVQHSFTVESEHAWEVLGLAAHLASGAEALWHDADRLA